MNLDEVRSALIEELVNVAPDLSPDEVRDEASLRDEYDLDSMDSFNLAAAIHKRFGVNIPEADFARLQSLSDLMRYLKPKI